MLNIITEIAKGISHLHQRQIIHGNLRGIKNIRKNIISTFLAAHILMTDEGQPKIANVGYPDTKDDRTRYWAPELFVKQEYSKVSAFLHDLS